MAVTIKGIARCAGGSRSTVSRTLHGHLVIAAQTAARIKGIVAVLGYVPSTMASSLKTCRSREQPAALGAPIACVHNRATVDGTHAVHHDDRCAGCVMTRQRGDLGHERFAYPGIVRGGQATGRRLAGLCDELQSGALPVTAAYPVHAHSSTPAGGAGGAREFLELGRRPSGIVCDDDLVAVGTIRGLCQAGWQVPRSCSVVGSDKISPSTFVSPSLTRSDRPKHESDRVAAEALPRMRSATPARESESSTLRGQILLRESSVPPPEAA